MGDGKTAKASTRAYNSNELVIRINPRVVRCDLSCLRISVDVFELWARKILPDTRREHACVMESNMARLGESCWTLYPISVYNMPRGPTLDFVRDLESFVI